jgi:hypothetical protein
MASEIPQLQNATMQAPISPSIELHKCLLHVSISPAGRTLSLDRPRECADRSDAAEHGFRAMCCFPLYMCAVSQLWVGT